MRGEIGRAFYLRLVRLVEEIEACERIASEELEDAHIAEQLTRARREVLALARIEVLR
jgi:hypothetical protein